MSDRRVLIAGAGPTGLALALALRAHDVEVDIVDTKTGPTRDSKALVIDPLTRHQLALLGEENVIGRQAVRVRQLSLDDRSPRDLRQTDASMNDLLLQPQRITEREMIGRLAARGTRVHWRRGLAAVADRGNHVDAELRDASGRTLVRTYDYVVGCEGKRSIVREAMGGTLLGPDYPMHVALGDFELDWDRPRDRIHHFIHPDTFFIIAPISSGRWRVCVRHRGAPAPGRTHATMITEPVIEKLGRDIFVGGPSWLSRAPLSVRCTDRMHAGRLFIAGDAAHQFAPLDGTGMNAGIADAINLGWKLGFDARGWVRDGRRLLASYEQERLLAARVASAAASDMIRELGGAASTGPDDPAKHNGLSLRYDGSTALKRGPGVGVLNVGLVEALSKAGLDKRSAFRILGFPEAGKHGEARQELSRLGASRAVDYLEISEASASRGCYGGNDLPSVQADADTWRRLGGKLGDVLVLRPDGIVAMHADYEDARAVIRWVEDLLGSPTPVAVYEDTCSNPIYL